MAVSLEQQVKQIGQWIDDYMAGAYPQRSALGPGALQKSMIRSNTVVSNMIDVQNLQAVSTQTGSLSVDGNIVLSTSGALYSTGKTAYADNDAGIWIGYDSGSGTYRVNVGDSTTFLKWDGASLSISGAITATSGTIGGWTIGATSLSSDTGSIGMASSGTYRFWSGNTTPASADFWVNNIGEIKAAAGTIGGWTLTASKLSMDAGATGLGVNSGYRIWVGNATPASAPFSVSSAGALVATSATITGAITSTSGSIGGWTIGSTTLTGGNAILDSAGKLKLGTGTDMIVADAADVTYRLWVGQDATNPSTAPFRVTKGGALTATSATITGAITATSGSLSALSIAGTLTIGASGKIIDGDGSFWDQGGFELKATGSAGDKFKWTRTGYTDKAGFQVALDTGLAQFTAYAASDSSSRQGRIHLNATAADSTTNVDLIAAKSGGTAGAEYKLSANGTHEWFINGSTIATLSSSLLTLAATIYASSISFDSGSHFISWNSPFWVFGAGDITPASGTINWNDSAFTGGAVANWSSGFVAGGYIKVKVGGVTKRIPYFNDA